MKKPSLSQTLAAIKSARAALLAVLTIVSVVASVTQDAPIHLPEEVTKEVCQ